MGLDGKLPMGEENSHSALSPTIHDTFPFVELLFLRSTGMDVEDPPMSMTMSQRLSLGVQTWM